jgi:RNA polymerase sigma factor (sigma-70 family)
MSALALAACLPTEEAPPERSDAERLALLKQYLPLVRHVASQYYPKLARFYDYDDIVAVGQMAVWAATATYREDGGASFKSYAYVSLVHRFELLRRTGRSQKRRGFVISMDEENEMGEPRHQYAGTDRSQDECLETIEGKALLTEVLGRLSPRERHVIEQRFVEERTFESIALDWEISRERIRQIEKRAVGKLRRWLLPYYPSARGGPAPVSSRQARPLTEREIHERQRLIARKVASDSGSR